MTVLLISVAPVIAQDDLAEEFEEFEDLEDAIAAGYVLLTPCIPDMGFHYVNPADMGALFAGETVVVLLYYEADLIGIEQVVLVSPGGIPRHPIGNL